MASLTLTITQTHFVSSWQLKSVNNICLHARIPPNEVVNAIHGNVVSDKIL